MSSLVFSFLSFLLLLFVVTKWLFFTPPGTKKNLPPSPSKLPLIGNLHQLGLLPHRSLRSLAQKHGPVMLVHLGQAPALVVSSVEGAQEVMKTHDIVFSDRSKSTIGQRMLYNYKELIMAPYGEYWRQAKSIYLLHLLSNRRVLSLRDVRSEETARMMERIKCSSALSSPVNLTEMFASLTYNVICRATLGRKFIEGKTGEKFKQLVTETITLVSSTDVGQLIPWLGWINRFNGFNTKVARVARELDEFLQGVVEERRSGVREIKEEERADFLDILLDAYMENNIAGNSTDEDCIKALIMTGFIAATDTSTSFLEWAMTDLLRHPRVIKKLQAEVREVLHGRLEVSQDDVEKMHYLKAVVKEVFRFHPPAPLLVPRVAREDVKVMGYDIAARTIAIINTWAIGRDPTLWDEPELFKPERFIDSDIELRGHDFRLIPFGAGRRGCPGMSFAMALNELVLVNLVYKFDWKLPGGAKPEELDQAECLGATARRKNPLFALATSCSC